MVISGSHHVPGVNNIMGGMEHTNGVRMHNHRRKLRQRFDLVRKLGQGTYGKVQLGINKETGQEVAIKTIKKAKIETEADLIRIRREIQIMSSVRHPNIIHIYEVFENKEKMVLVMEYAAGGELYDYLSERKVLTELEARRVFRQVASAVYYCHKHKICHRDLKLENILLDESKSAKIADFGLSNVFDDRRLLTTFCGSPLYASPEIVRGTPYHGPEVDCWSLGVLLYTLVYGAMPFDGSNFKRLVRQISSGEYYEPPDKPSTASPLVRHMLLVDPTKRASVEDICSHWWVNEGYGESCLEVAEELANQTPVRLDLLLSLIPPSSDDDVNSKLESPTSSVAVSQAAEGDSMNDYYSAHSGGHSKTDVAARSGGVADAGAGGNAKASKKKKDHSGKGKESSKRRKADTPAAMAEEFLTKLRSPGSDPPADADRTSDSLPPIPPFPGTVKPSSMDDCSMRMRMSTDVTTSGEPEQPAEEVFSGAAPVQSTEPADVVSDAVDAVDKVDTADTADTEEVADTSATAAAVAAAVATAATAATEEVTATATATASATALAAPNTEEVMDIDEGISTSSSWTAAHIEPASMTSSMTPNQLDISPVHSPITDNTPCLLPTPAVVKESKPEVEVEVKPEEPLVADDVAAAPQEASLSPKAVDPEAPCPEVDQLQSPPPPPPPPPTPPAAPTPPPLPTPAVAEADPQEIAVIPPKIRKNSKSRPKTDKTGEGDAAAAAASATSVASVASVDGVALPSQRNSKILKQAEMFNNLSLAKSEPKSTMTLERPKKVTIYGFKVSDARRAYETKAENKPTVFPALKVSDAKKAFEVAASAAAAAAAAAATPSKIPVGHNHNSLPRRTLIQIPASSSSGGGPSGPEHRHSLSGHGHHNHRSSIAADENDKQVLGVQPGEKVVVGGLGVKIGAIGKVTEIGMKTEESVAPLIDAVDAVSGTETDAMDVQPASMPAAPEAVKEPEVAENPPEEIVPVKEMAVAEVEVKASGSSTGSAAHSPEVSDPIASLAAATPTDPLPPVKATTPEVPAAAEVPVVAEVPEVPEVPAVAEVPVVTEVAVVPIAPVTFVHPIAAITPSVSSYIPAKPNHLAVSLLPTLPSPTTSGAVRVSPVRLTPFPPCTELAYPAAFRTPSPPPATPPTPQSVRAVKSPSPTRHVKATSQPPQEKKANGDGATSQPLSKPTSLPLNAALMSPSTKMTSSSTQPLSPPLAAITRLLERTTPRGNEELTMEHCVAGSENAFLRSLRSPTRDNQVAPATPATPATPTAPKNNQKRFSIEHSRALSPIDTLKDGLTSADEGPGMKTKPSTPVAQAPRCPDRFTQPIATPSTPTTASVSLETTNKPLLKSSELKMKLNAAEPGKAIHKTEMSFPVASAATPTAGTPSVGTPSGTAPGTPSGMPRERIIPIRVEGRDTSGPTSSSSVPSTPRTPIATNHFLTPPPVTASPPPRVKPIHLNTTNPTRRRQDSFRNPSGAREPIRKSPREFIIPITLEGGGCITPLTPMTPMTPMTPKSPVTPGTPMTPSEDGIRPTASANVRQKSNRPDRSRRHGGLYHDLAGEHRSVDGTANPLHALQRLSSLKKCCDGLRQDPSDNGVSGGSGSSGDDDDDDDDDTFQILTAESLFSTLLNRVRQLTKRNSRDGGADPFALFRNSRLTSPTPSAASGSRCSETATATPVNMEPCDAGNAPATPTSPAGSNPPVFASHRNSIGSDLGSASKGLWSRASSVASDADTNRRYSTLDHPRVNREEQSGDPSNKTLLESIASASILSRVRSSTPGTATARLTFTLHVSVPPSPTRRHGNMQAPGGISQPDYLKARTPSSNPTTPS